VTDPVSTGRNGPQTSGKVSAGKVLLLSVVFLALGAFGGFAYRGHVNSVDIRDSTQRGLEFQSENAKLKAQVFELNTKLEQVLAQIESVQATMQSIVPSKNSYVIGVNKSMVVAGGHLIVGLIGSPTSKNLKLNVNGKEHVVAAGDIIQADPDPSTKCKVTVQYFDMFKAFVIASCEGTKR
jgi:hypothetical protein